MTLIKNWTSRSMQCYNILVPCNMSPTAMTQGIGTDGHPQSRTSGQTLSSLSEAAPSAIWIPPTSWVMWCAWIRGAQILDYGVHDHIAHICAPFFEGIESRSQYENRRRRWEEEHRHTQMTSGDHWSPSCGPDRRNWEQDKWGPKMTKQGGRSCSESRRRQGIREQQSHSTRRGGSWMPRGRSPHDPSCPRDRKLPMPPWPLWDKVVKGIDRPEWGLTDGLQRHHGAQPFLLYVMGGSSAEGGGTTKVWFQCEGQPWVRLIPSSIRGRECQRCLHGGWQPPPVWLGCGCWGGEGREHGHWCTC